MLTWEAYMDIFRLKADGYSKSAIARMTGYERKTVRKYLKEGGNAFVYSAKWKKLSKLDSYILFFYFPLDFFIFLRILASKFSYAPLRQSKFFLKEYT